MIATRRQGYTFTVSLFVPLAAAAAEQVQQTVDPSLVPFATWLSVIALAGLGWSASSLSLLAGWVDGSTADRLKIVQGVIASMLAGIITFLLGRHFGSPDLLTFIGVAGAGFMGDKYLMPMFQRVLGAIWPNGNGGGVPPRKGGSE